MDDVRPSEVVREPNRPHCDTSQPLFGIHRDVTHACQTGQLLAGSVPLVGKEGPGGWEISTRWEPLVGHKKIAKEFRLVGR